MPAKRGHEGSAPVGLWFFYMCRWKKSRGIGGKGGDLKIVKRSRSLNSIISEKKRGERGG